MKTEIDMQNLKTAIHDQQYKIYKNSNLTEAINEIHMYVVVLIIKTKLKK